MKGQDNFKKRTKEILVFILFLIYAAVLLRITVFRSSLSFDNILQMGHISFSLFQGYVAIIRARDWFTFTYLFWGNIIWFIPFGMYLEYIGKVKNVLVISFYGFLFSLMIETLQYVFGTGYSELDDLILNTLGVFIGAVCYKLIKKIYKKSAGLS